MKMIVLSGTHIDLPGKDERFSDNLGRCETVVERMSSAYIDADLEVSS